MDVSLRQNGLDYAHDLLKKGNIENNNKIEEVSSAIISYAYSEGRTILSDAKAREIALHLSSLGISTISYPTGGIFRLDALVNEFTNKELETNS